MSGLQKVRSLVSLNRKAQPIRSSLGRAFSLFPREGSRANWLATFADKGYFVILRLYGPTEAAINKSWKPGDIEK
jgi:hypothetical protein